MGCGPTSASGNCPTPLGPDYDFGAAPMLFTLKSGKQVVMAGQKSGIVYGLNPDTGALLWKTIVGAGSALGGVEWGIGGGRHATSTCRSPTSPCCSARRPQSKAKAGIYALDPATGAIAWSTAAPSAPCVYASDKGKPSRCARAQSAAPAVMPGLVFEGGMDGWFRAYDSKTGKIVWEYSTTARTYDTVNGIKGQPGGGIDGMGADHRRRHGVHHQRQQRRSPDRVEWRQRAPGLFDRRQVAGRGRHAADRGSRSGGGAPARRPHRPRPTTRSDGARPSGGDAEGRLRRAAGELRRALSGQRRAHFQGQVRPVPRAGGRSRADQRTARRPRPRRGL